MYIFNWQSFGDGSIISVYALYIPIPCLWLYPKKDYWSINQNLLIARYTKQTISRTTGVTLFEESAFLIIYNNLTFWR